MKLNSETDEINATLNFISRFDSETLIRVEIDTKIILDEYREKYQPLMVAKSQHKYFRLHRVNI